MGEQLYHHKPFTWRISFTRSPMPMRHLNREYNNSRHVYLVRSGCLFNSSNVHYPTGAHLGELVFREIIKSLSIKAMSASDRAA